MARNTKTLPIDDDLDDTNNERNEIALRFTVAAFEAQITRRLACGGMSFADHELVSLAEESYRMADAFRTVRRQQEDRLR